MSKFKDLWAIFLRKVVKSKILTAHKNPLLECVHPSPPADSGHLPWHIWELAALLLLLHETGEWTDSEENYRAAEVGWQVGEV